MTRQIIAISGGGFSTETPSYIDEYIVNQVRSDEKIRICFIPTASNDAQGYIDRFYAAFGGCEASHIRQEEMSSKEKVREKVLHQHILYVGGGSTQVLLNKWREHGFDEVVKEAYRKGVLLAGISAGAMCWFERCYSEKANDLYEEFEGLGLLKGTFCPHYDDLNRQTMFDEWIKGYSSLVAYPLLNSETIHFREEKLIAKIRTF